MKATIKTASSKPDGLPDSPRYTLTPPPPPTPPPQPPPKPPSAGPKDENPKRSKKGSERKEEVEKSKKGSKEGSKKKNKKGRPDGSDPSSSSSSSSSTVSRSSGDESIPDKKEKKKKRELSNSDGERFSLGDHMIKRHRLDTNLSADAPKRTQIAKPPMFDSAKDSKLCYWQWTKILQHFLEYHMDTWRRDEDMIMTVGSIIRIPPGTGSTPAHHENSNPPLGDTGKKQPPSQNPVFEFTQ